MANAEIIPLFGDQATIQARADAAAEVFEAIHVLFPPELYSDDHPDVILGEWIGEATFDFLVKPAASQPEDTLCVFQEERARTILHHCISRVITVEDNDTQAQLQRLARAADDLAATYTPIPQPIDQHQNGLRVV